MGKIAFLFLLLAIAIGYDAITHDGAYTKDAWAKVVTVGTDIAARVERGFDTEPAANPELRT